MDRQSRKQCCDGPTEHVPFLPYFTYAIENEILLWKTKAKKATCAECADSSTTLGQQMSQVSHVPLIQDGAFQMMKRLL